MDNKLKEILYKIENFDKNVEKNLFLKRNKNKDETIGFVYILCFFEFIQID
jgi:hypothetical protein